jgi:hypothetical protein
MNEKEVIEIVKESRLWEGLTAREKQDAIKHALDITFGTWECAMKSLDEIEGNSPYGESIGGKQ